MPPKYGMCAFNNFRVALEHNRVQNPSLRYNNKEFKYAFEHPAILHYTGPKPYKSKEAIHYSVWWNYAKKTDYYVKIYNYSLKYFNNSDFIKFS